MKSKSVKAIKGPGISISNKFGALGNDGEENFQGEQLATIGCLSVVEKFGTGQ